MDITWWIIWLFLLARLYINFVTGINLEISFALWVNFLGISLPFLGSWIWIWFTALFGIFSFPSWLARLHGIFQNHFLLLSLSLAHSLSRSSWLLLSLLILALDPSLSSSLFKKFHQLRYESAMDGAQKINLVSFRLWPPCCATPSSSWCVRAHEQYR